MELTLDYNIELFPLQAGTSFALALASSLSRNPQGTTGAPEDEDKDRDIWRPDAKGRRGLDDDYEYVMYGKVGSTTLCPSYAARMRIPCVTSFPAVSVFFVRPVCPLRQTIA